MTPQIFNLANYDKLTRVKTCVFALRASKPNVILINAH